MLDLIRHIEYLTHLIKLMNKKVGSKSPISNSFLPPHPFSTTFLHIDTTASPPPPTFIYKWAFHFFFSRLQTGITDTQGHAAGITPATPNQSDCLQFAALIYPPPPSTPTRLLSPRFLGIFPLLCFFFVDFIHHFLSLAQSNWWYRNLSRLSLTRWS